MAFAVPHLAGGPGSRRRVASACPGRRASRVDFGKGYPSRRSDGVKLQTILGNSGDFDMERVGGPTGWGAEALDRGIKSFQKRNGLEVDGWVRPGGPTITKMKEQFGGLLSDFEAPTPKQADTNLRLRDAGQQGFLKSKRQDLLLPPIPGLPKPDDNILGANHSLVRNVRDNGLRDTPDWMAKSVRRDQKEGVVEARDFVDQLEQLIPGEGTKAVRGILQALADTPPLQQAFFGGPVVDLAPIGVFEPDGPARYEEAIKTRPWEDYENGRDPVAGTQIRDYRPERDGIPEIVTRPMTDAQDVQVRPRDAGADAPVFNDGLLDPTSWPEQLRASETTDKANADTATQQEAQARPQRNPENIDRYFDELDKRVQELAKRWNTDPNFIHALFSMESGWFDEKARARNNPFGYTVQPNSAAERAGQRAGLPTQIGSLDRAFQQWSDKWGPRIRESENLHDFLENIQLGGSDMYNKAHSVPNEGRPRVDRQSNEPIKSYEARVEEQYRTVLNRRRLWEQNRQ